MRLAQRILAENLQIQRQVGVRVGTAKNPAAYVVEVDDENQGPAQNLRQAAGRFVGTVRSRYYIAVIGRKRERAGAIHGRSLVAGDMVKPSLPTE